MYSTLAAAVHGGTAMGESTGGLQIWSPLLHCAGRWYCSWHCSGCTHLSSTLPLPLLPVTKVGLMTLKDSADLVRYRVQLTNVIGSRAIMVSLPGYCAVLYCTAAAVCLVVCGMKEPVNPDVALLTRLATRGAALQVQG